MLRALAAACAVVFTLAPARAEEGMWTFDNFPSERMQRELGWAPSEAWLARILPATARVPGCSASVVSSEGLALTNHHCVIACIGDLSAPAANTVVDGFVARTRDKERRCEAMSASVLAGVEDVTDRIDAAAADAPPEAFAQARNREIARIESGCASGAMRCEVVALYQGGRYALHRYRHYDDVRLVFAPEHAMAAFGGDADNFEFPRHCADFAFIRVYENGAPAQTPAHLSMRFTAPEDGEIVIASGSPGATSRLRTVAELEFERDVNLPWRLEALTGQRARMLAYARSSEDHARISASALQNVENTLKALSGRRAALAGGTGLARVMEAELDMQARVRRNRASTREVGDAWAEIARAQQAYRAFHREHQLLEARAGGGSELFQWARDIVRGGAEREKAEAERIPRFAQARLPGLLRSLSVARAVEPELEAVNLAAWLQLARDQLPAAMAGAVLGHEHPDALAARLSMSRLADPAYRTELWRGGRAAVSASDDPMIVFVRAWDEQARAVRARYVAEVEAPAARAHERIARARFRAFGESRYPDATGSPRLSYGRVSGWNEAEAVIGPFTRTAELYERASGAAPLALTPNWLSARGRLNPDTVFNFVSTNDLTGGNSGSPLLDRDGRVLGVVFDGNIHSLGGEYFYDGARNRAVTVSSAIIRESLLVVYDMRALVAELER